LHRQGRRTTFYVIRGVRRREDGAMRTLHVLAAALAAAIVAGALAVTLGVGSSHREAPLTSLDPTADDTDVYAFTAPDAPGR
jgi:hypothetical protein